MGVTNNDHVAKMDEELDSHDELVLKPNTKSMIWTYFGVKSKIQTIPSAEFAGRSNSANPLAVKVVILLICSPFFAITILKSLPRYMR